jgi:hypothetical protein
MRVRPFYVLLFLGVLFALIIAGLPARSVAAQACYDRQTGKQIPCPQEEQPRKKQPKKTPFPTNTGPNNVGPTEPSPTSVGPQPYPQPYPKPYPGPGGGSGGGPVVALPWWWILLGTLIAALFLRPLLLRPWPPRPGPGPDPGPLNSEGELLPAVQKGQGSDQFAKNYDHEDTEM